MAAEMSIILCSLNGAAGVDRCLRALGQQTIRDRLQVIVVDDGSADDTSAVAAKHGVTVIRHEVNRGISAARNSGLTAAQGRVVAFVDDDCEPEPGWAAHLLATYGDNVIGAGGPILPTCPPGYLAGYLGRHNPLQPQEKNLAKSDRIAYRFYLYLRRQWARPQPGGRRDVYSLVGANMSFLRAAVTGIGGFDERFRFGAEEVDLCRRLVQAYPQGRLAYIPEARVRHHFEPALRDTLRRSRAYGRASARLYHKGPAVPPTLFPFPFLTVAMLAAAARHPLLILAAAAVPQICYPQGLRHAVTGHGAVCVLDPYVQLAQETCENAGFLAGLWRFRRRPADSGRATPFPGLAERQE